jgi:hypothetical protein
MDDDMRATTDRFSDEFMFIWHKGREHIIANVTDNIDAYFLGQGVSGVAFGAHQRSHPKNATEFQGAACSPKGILLHPENSCLIISLDLD